MSLRIEIRDPRVGRLSLSAGTTSTRERDRRRASLLQLIETERGRAIVQRLRDRKLKIGEVHRAVAELDLGALEEKAKAKELPPIGLGQTIDQWLKYLEGANRSKQTLAFYRSIANDLERHFGVKRERRRKLAQDVAIADITREQGETWLTEIKPSIGKSWAPRSQTVAHSLAAQIWDRAITADEDRAQRTGTEPTIPRNFWRRQGGRKGITPAKIRRTRVEFLSRVEAARVLRKAKHSERALWVAVGIYAGLRGGEAANLRRGVDVDMVNRLFDITARKGEHEWRTKTENSVRKVPINRQLARWIRLHVREGFAGELYLFRQPGKDRPLTRGAWRVWTKQAFEDAGIRYGRKKDALVAHSMRHTFASWLTKEDVHPLKIAQLMGDTVEEVMRTYAHLAPGDLREAVDRL